MMKETAAATALVACLLAELLALNTFVLASEEEEGKAVGGEVGRRGAVSRCPVGCRCETRPWFSPSSAYAEAATVDCNDLGLHAVPAALPADTQVLLLQTNNIVDVREALDYLANVTEIDLSQNNISSLRAVRLGALPRLVSLHVEENRVRALADGCLPALPALQELYVNHNLVSSISPGAFRGLGRLLRLHLNSNRLTAIDGRWFAPLPDLEILMIGENPVVRLADMSFRFLVNLRSLVLARMNLTEVPDDALAGLEQNLESISFFDNLLDRVPRAALSRARNLKFLDLNKNPVQRIQRGDFMDMLHLKELGINSMPELVSIDSYALNNLPELTKIEATNNPKLSYIHPKAFHKLPRLETLMLNSNALSALHRGTVDSLPSLREVSLHSNPIRCDCVVRWINMNRTALRFMEPHALYCATPPEYQGLHVRQVHFREMTEICVPLISPGSLPERLSAAAGGSVTLHCRAFGEPEPEIYWVTPSGDRVLPDTTPTPSEKYHLHPEGTLHIHEAGARQAGTYTCVAHNLVGADLRSVALTVDGYFPDASNRSLRVRVRSVQTHSVMVSWESPGGGAVSRLRWHATTTTTLAVDASAAAFYTARVPSDVKEYHLLHLEPATPYRVCVEAGGVGAGAAPPTSSSWRRNRDCVNVTTRGLPPPRTQPPSENEQAQAALVLSAAVVLCFAVAAACFVIPVRLMDRAWSSVDDGEQEAEKEDQRALLLGPDGKDEDRSPASSSEACDSPGVKVRATLIDLPDDDTI